ncbi:Ig-like domain-containing protein [Marinitoga aeolica]|uniref:Penicillin-binding C-terminal domain-containing protein n=1 Tax=Marinitoga aeolica TaxID=2809031 RepID=A0ABY8PSM9_9BACT|nr:PKD-like domain-containing protein [Marinitoga aeolica]WGS65643.1 hypothetical protein JRV97_03565 [Marinitoga aeolica]
MENFKKYFSLFMILMIFIVSFATVKNVTIRTKNIDTWDFNVSTDYAIITPGIILNGDLFSATVKNDTNPATIFADITLSVLSGEWEGDYLIVRFGPINLKSGETFILKNTEVLDYLDKVSLKENNMTHISDLKDTSDFLNLELAEGKYSLNIKIIELENNEEVEKGSKTSNIAIIKPDPIEFIKLPEGDTLYPTIKWSLSRVPWYSETKSILEIEENGKKIFSRTFKHNKPDQNVLDLDIKGYPTGNNIEDGVFTYNITGEDNDPVFKRGKTYTFRVIMKDSGNNEISKTLDENVTFNISYPDMVFPVGEIDNIKPIFEWSFEYDSEVAYYLLKIDGVGNYKVYGSQSFELPKTLEWGKSYKWKVIPYYEDNTPFFDDSEIDWVEFSTPQNNPPEVSILSPSDGDYLLYNEEYTFEGEAIDNDPEDEITKTWWEIDGKTYEGNSITFIPKKRYMDNPLKIKFFAKDKYDHISQTEINVFVKQPKLKITSPANNSKFAAGESVEFKAISQDLDEDIIWYDNGNEIGNGNSFEYAFDETGEHSIEAISGDYSDSITIFIEALPVLKSEETEFETYINESISLTVDYENLNPDEIQWVLNGRTIGNGSALEFASDQPGEYTVIAKYKDLSVEFHIKVKAIPQVRIIAPLENAKIKAGEEITLKSEAKNIEEDIIWYLDDVEIGRGKEIKFTFSNELEGTHILKVESGIASNEITIEIYVERSVTITDPESRLLVIDINKTYSFKAKKENIEEEIQWFINDEVVGSGDTFEYTFTNSGEYIVKAVAGGFSDEVTVKVVGEKYLIIKSPLDGAKFEVGENIKFSVDAKNLIEDIIWYANGEEIGKGNTIEYAFNESGSYEITAKSGDLENSITIEILLPENIKIVSPDDGAEFFVGKEIEFNAEGENLRSNIQWFVNGVLIGSGESITYTFNTAGNYEIKAKTETVESIIKIKILESQTLKIISPKNDDIYKLGETIKLRANTKYETTIEWYANGEYLGEGNEFNFTPEESGKYEIKAIADNIEKTVEIYVYKPIGNLTINGLEKDIFFDDETIELNAVYDYDETIGIKERKWILDGKNISDTDNITLSELKPGLHVVQFKIWDNMNNHAESKVTINVVERLEIEILSPEEDAHFNLNDSIRLKVGLKKGKWNQIKEINWYFNDNKIANGRDALVSNVGEGDIIIRVEVIDILDEVYTKEININISDKPVLEILEPKNNSTFKYGDEIKAVGTVYITTLEGRKKLDTNDITWYVDGDEIENGGVVFIENLKPGEHTIQAEYKDLTSEINIKILEPAKAEILEPDELAFNPGDKLTIKGKGDGILTWYLNENEIGNGSILNLDTQNITSKSKLTLKAIFNDIESEYSITLLPNSKPVINWESPDNEEKFVSNANIPINVKVEDKEDGLLSYELYIDGKKLGENIDSIFAGTLKAGPHTLKIISKDKLGVEVSEARKIIINQKPNPTIISPQNGQEITAGMTLTLEAIVQDDDQINEDKIIWMIDGEQIGSGLKIGYTKILSTGEHFIDLYVEDSMGEYVQLSSDIIVVEKPNIRITQPIDGSVINIGNTLVLQAEAFKGPNLPYEDDKVTWKIDGVITGTGKRLEVNTNSLISGEHAITAMVENVSDTVRIMINTPPNIDITQPLDGSILSTKDLIIFNSSISDLENNVKPENIKWIINGEEKGSGISYNAGNLGVGDYRVTAKITDDNGLSNEKTISIKVISPLKTDITSPENNSGFSQTDIINLSANISGGLEPYNITWTIKQPNTPDKTLNGNNLTLNAFDLNPGKALITFEVKDSLGNVYTETREITIFEKIKVKIVKPENGQVFVKGQENINAVAQLFNEKGKNATVEWLLNDQKVGEGNVLNLDTKDMPNGNYILKVIVKSKKEEDSDSINIAIREKLKVKIISIYDTVKSENEIELKAFALDPLDGEIENIEWNSNLQGTLGTGKEIKIKLIPGSHIITATAKNSKGKTAKDSINILSIGETKMSIESPNDGDIFTGSVEIPFKAKVMDADGSEISPENIIWISSIDGQIGNGTEINKKLSAGKHEITLSAMSKYNGSITKKISIQVLEEAKVEQKLVIDVEDGLLVIQNQPVELSAYKIGVEGDIVWTSDIDGELGTGDTIEAILSTPGEHEITASVGDISKSVKVKVIPYKEKREVIAVVIGLKGVASTKYKDNTNDLKILSPLYNGDTLIIYNETEIKLAFKDGSQKTYTINTNEGTRFEDRREITFNE